MLCPICGGNDGDVPCAYTTERPAGCLRVKRLECPTCEGGGEIWMKEDEARGSARMTLCPDCHGTGFTITSPPTP